MLFMQSVIVLEMSESTLYTPCNSRNHPAHTFTCFFFKSKTHLDLCFCSGAPPRIAKNFSYIGKTTITKCYCRWCRCCRWVLFLQNQGKTKVFSVLPPTAPLAVYLFDHWKSRALPQQSMNVSPQWILLC